MLKNKYIIDTCCLPKSNYEELFFITESQVLFGEIESPKAKEFGKIKLNKFIFEEAKRITNFYINTDKDLVSLTKNEGSSDPFIISSAIIKNREEEKKLFKEYEWIVVTDEKNIQAICLESDICFLPGKNFRNLFKF